MARATDLIQRGARGQRASKTLWICRCAAIPRRNARHHVRCPKLIDGRSPLPHQDRPPLVVAKQEEALWPRRAQLDHRDYPDCRLASTVGWPLSALLLHQFGWRSTCLMWAGLNMLLAAPLNWLIIPAHGMPGRLREVKTELPTAAAPRAAMPILSSFSLLPGSSRARWRRICRACCRRRAPPRLLQ